VSDVPLGPGFPNPFGFDLEQLMRMLQSQGPVNFEIALQVATTVATADAQTGQPTTEPAIEPAVRQSFEDVVRAAQVSVADTTGIATTLGIRSECVDRREWARATLNELTPVLTALAGALQRPGAGEYGPDDPSSTDPADIGAFLMQSLLPLLIGVWAGSMIGQLAHHALGQYDLPLPLHGPPTQRFLVRNVQAFGAEWELAADELRYALALREVVHGAQRSVPWVREELERLATAYVGAYEVQPDALQEQLGDIDLSDPSASMANFTELGDPSLLLGAMRSERQAPLLEELQRFVSVLEGYTDIVAETIGGQMMASHARIDEALKRHRLERGEADAFVDQLLGLQLDRGHYDAGIVFSRGVVERGGLEQLNRLWTSREMMPTRSELEAPGLWLARIDL
jgi:putative hydrolase